MSMMMLDDPSSPPEVFVYPPPDELKCPVWYVSTSALPSLSPLPPLHPPDGSSLSLASFTSVSSLSFIPPFPRNKLYDFLLSTQF